MFKILSVFLFLAVLATKATAERKSHFLIGGPFFSEFLEEDDYVGVGSCTGRPVMKWNRRGKAKEETDKEMTKEVSAKKVKKVEDKKKMEEKESKPTMRESLVSLIHRRNLTTLGFAPSAEKTGWFSALKFDELTDSME